MADDKGFEADLVKKAGKAGDKAGQSLGQRLSAGIKKTFLGGEIGKGLTQGLGLAGGLGAANALASGIRKVSDFIGQAEIDASNLGQSVGAIESVFGRASRKIEDFGKTAFQTAGLSKRAVNEMAAVIGAGLQGMGFSADEAAAKTIDLEKRAADMAATFGGTTSDAIEAITALLRGERDPIEKYGVSLKDADVKARILAKGLDTSTTAAEKNANAVASLELLMEATAKTTGQFARETDSAAGSAAILNAKLENTSALVGEKLLPAQIAWNEALLYGLDRSTVPLEKLQTAAARGSQGAQAQLHQLEFVAREMGVSLEDAWAMTNNASSFSVDVLRANTEQMTTDVESMKGNIFSDANLASSAIKGIGTSAKTAAGKVTSALDEMLTGFKDTRDELANAGKGAADAYWDPLIAAADLAATNREIAEQKQIASSKKSTKEQVQDAQRRLLELRQTQLEQLATLASYGDKSAAAALKTQIDVLKSTKGLSQEQIAWLNKLESELAQATRAARNLGDALRPNRGGDSSRGRARGGYFPPGWSGTVGEEGSERLISFSGGGGYVVPHDPADDRLASQLYVPGATSVPESMFARGPESMPAPGDTYHTTLNITNPVPHAADEDIGRTLRRLAALGIRG